MIELIYQNDNYKNCAVDVTQQSSEELIPLP